MASIVHEWYFASQTVLKGIRSSINTEVVTINGPFKSYNPSTEILTHQNGSKFLLYSTLMETSSFLKPKSLEILKKFPKE